MKRMIRTAVAVVATLVAGATLGVAEGASAATITFETAPPGPGFVGPVTESGYAYSTQSGGLFVNAEGPGNQNDMEGTEAVGGGVLLIVSAGANPDFRFANLDYSAYSGEGAAFPPQTLTVIGYNGATVVGTDNYTLANTSNFFPTYDNWTTEDASNLAGKTLTSLQIDLNAGESPIYYNESIDNVVLNAVPEPATWAMLIVGVAGVGMALRRRKHPAALASA